MGSGIFSKVGHRLVLGLGGRIKLMRQLILQGSDSRTLSLNPSVWDDLKFPAQAVKAAPGKEPTWTAYKGGLVLSFDKIAILGNEQGINFNVQLDHAYEEGADIEVHVHWVGETTNVGDVYWRLTHSWANIHEVFPAETTIYIADDNSTIADTHDYADFGFISGAGKKISSMLICSLFRHSSNILDTYADEAYLVEIDFHQPKDTLGSRQEAIK